MAVPDPLESYRRQQEHLRRLLENPALKFAREQQERIRDLIDPPAMRQMREQQERIRDLIDPPAMRQMREQQERLRDLMDPPAMRWIREQQERLRDAADPPALRWFREQQAQLVALLDTPAFRALRQQPKLWSEALTPDVLEAIESYEADLAARVAAADDEQIDETAVEGGEPWFGAPSWGVLLNELQGLLKVLELLTAGLTAANMELQTPPTGLIAILIVLVAAAEFALWLANPE